MNSVSHRRLVGALASSIVLHLLALIPLRLSLDSPAETQQIYLQASVTRTKPAAARPEEARAPARKQDPTPPVKRITKPHGAKHTVPSEQPAKPPAAEEPIPEVADALVLDQPLLPEYPAAALAQGLEGCVLASVQVNTAGEVESVSILAADHPGVFDQSVIDAQKSARYAPARQGSESIPSRVLAVAAFVIEPGKQLDCPLKYAPLAERRLRSNAP
jgi:TonB family protein